MCAMNSRNRRKKSPVPLALTWSHGGVPWRVTSWPEVRFECRYGDEWIPATPTEEALASAAQTCGPLGWQPYLEFVPAEVREFLGRFAIARMEALLVVARCPALLRTLADTPALTAYLAAHASLRGTPEPKWAEIGAVHERSGVFGLLEWLGLPASRQTLAILRAIAEPDLPKRFLEPLRSLLWEPTTIFALQRLPAISDRQLARYCHALAA
jgi:hypothetical protein